MPNTKLTVIRKLHTADIASDTEAIGGTARKSKIQPDQIRNG